MDTRCRPRCASNSGSEMTYEAVDYAAYHFGITDEGIGVLHAWIDLQPALQDDSMHDRGGVGRPAEVELA